jgi:replicative DNA helicase
MFGHELMTRAICSQAGLDLQRVRDGFFNQSALTSAATAAQHLVKAPLYLDETSDLTVAQFRARARRARAAHKIGLIVVDYLQFMHGTTSTAKQSRAIEVSEISKAIKSTAKELDIPIIALAQLNRDADGDHIKPKLSNLRESGSIEQDADTVLLIHRLKEEKPFSKNKKTAPDEDEPPRDHNTLLILAKQRHGPTPEIKMNFIGQFTRFENVTTAAYSNNPDHRQK